MDSSLSRRSFAKGIFAGAAGLAGASMLAACSPGSNAAESSSATNTESVDYASQVTETIDTDVVVVGAGMSGLTAAVQALESGASVTMIEAMNATGGNATMISCIMGVATEQQKALGIDIRPADIIADEMKSFNYLVDGTRWRDLVYNSADNINWLMTHNVVFGETIDNYLGLGTVKTAHWFEGGLHHDAGSASYVEPMTAEVEVLGGEILFETRGRQLILAEDGSIAGVYAETADGVIQLNAKAVIIATGGYADNDEMIAERGTNPAILTRLAKPGHNGDGINMAIEAGGRSWLDRSSLMAWNSNPLSGNEGGETVLLTAPDSIWINERGVRFADESCMLQQNAWAGNAVAEQKVSFALFNDEQLETYRYAHPQGADQRAIIEKEVEKGYTLKSDTLEDLAEQAGLDPEALVSTFETYMGYCDAKDDVEFGKDAMFLNRFDTPPYYLSYNYGYWVHTSLGGISTTHETEVRTADGEDIIKGLYAVGVDGVELFRGFYTLDTPGSCNANNVNSGRTAGRKAAELAKA